MREKDGQKEQYVKRMRIEKGGITDAFKQQYSASALIL